MGKEGSSLFQKIFFREQEAAAQQEKTESTRLGRREEKLFNSVHRRIDNNKAIIDSWGIKDIFGQIKSENLLASPTEINEGTIFSLSEEEIRQTIKNTLDLRTIGNREAEDQILRLVDKQSFISLHWDYESPPVLKEGAEEGAIVISEPMKHLCFGFLEGNPYLKYSTADYKQYKSIWLKKRNLDKDLSHAIIMAEKTSNWDVAAQIYP